MVPRLVNGYGPMAGRLCIILFTIRISRPIIFTSLRPLRINRLASVLQQKPTSSKSSPPGYRQFTLDTSVGAPLGHMFSQWWIYGDLMCTICDPCAIIIKFSASGCLFPCFWNFLVDLNESVIGQFVKNAENAPNFVVSLAYRVTKLDRTVLNSENTLVCYCKWTYDVDTGTKRASVWSLKTTEVSAFPFTTLTNSLVSSVLIAVTQITGR